MKAIIRILAIVIATGFLLSCKEKHTIRFANNYPEKINNIYAGSAYLGDVESGGTSAYKSIETGNFQVSGVSATGKTLSANGTISGKGKNQWTLTLNSAGELSIARDK
jgi:hypothetical protein